MELPPTQFKFNYNKIISNFLHHSDSHRHLCFYSSFSISSFKALFTHYQISLRRICWLPKGISLTRTFQFSLANCFPNSHLKRNSFFFFIKKKIKGKLVLYWSLEITVVFKITSDSLVFFVKEWIFHASLWLWRKYTVIHKARSK